MRWRRWQGRERASGRSEEAQHDAESWPRGAGRNLCREEQQRFMTSHMLDRNFHLRNRSGRGSGLQMGLVPWAAEMGLLAGFPGNPNGLWWTHKKPSGMGELRNARSDSCLPVCFPFPQQLLNLFQGHPPVLCQGLKFPGKFSTQLFLLKERDLTNTRKSIKKKKKSHRQAGVKLFFFAGMRFLCWHQEVKTHADVLPSGCAFSTAGSMLRWGEASFKPGRAVLWHCRGRRTAGSGKPLAAAGTWGKPCCLIQPK